VAQEFGPGADRGVGEIVGGAFAFAVPARGGLVG
jgi:hypothetical protein